MRFVHLSDIHVGKTVNEFSMIEDQRYILNDIIEKITHLKPHVVIIAGDVYDKSVPSAEAVELLDEFITKLSAKKIPIYIISGNHDSGTRLNFGSKLMESNQVYISGTYNGTLDCHTVSDEYGEVNIYMLPFIKPAVVRGFFENEQIDTYEQAVQAVIDAANIDKSQRNILVAHQFVTAGTLQPERTLSENVSVGGVDNIDIKCFDGFDYVALGHLHNPQRVGKETVRYCGTPLKYSFSESTCEKSLTAAEIKEKNNVEIAALPLVPLRDMRCIKGKIDVLLSKEIYSAANRNDYLQVILTDEEELFEPMNRLRRVYPNIMRLDFDNARTRVDNSVADVTDMESKSTLELFEEFYKLQNNAELNPPKEAVLKDIIERLEETV